MMIRLVLSLCLLCVLETHGARRRCINSGILFAEKTLRSPLVVYGESLAKRAYVDTDTELLFNVTFRVDCILKGQAIESRIEITDAGIKAGHMACQWLDPGHSYVVFLEKWGMNVNSYRPLDFQEHMADNITYELLTKTCSLTRTLPLHSTTNTCPNASMPVFCPHDKDDVSVIPKQEYSGDIKPVVRTSYFDHGSLFQLQSNVTVPQNGYVITNYRGLAKNNACSLTISGILWMAFVVMSL